MLLGLLHPRGIGDEREGYTQATASWDLHPGYMTKTDVPIWFLINNLCSHYLPPIA